MEHTNKPSRGRGQEEERFQNQKKRSPYVRRSPDQVLKNQRDNPGRVTETGKDPRTTRKYAGNVNTQENVRSHYHRTRSIKGRAATLKGRDGQSLARLRGGFHATCKWRCLEQCPYRDAKKQKHRPHARERGEAEILRHPDNTPAAQPKVRLPEVPLASHHACKASA